MGEMGKVFWAHSFGVIGSSLVTVFIPIFLYKLGYSDPANPDLPRPPKFRGVFGAVPATRVIDKIGANRSMALAEVFHTAFFVGLLLLPGLDRSLAVLVPIGLTWSVTRALYWPSFHANFSKARAHQKAGNQVGAINAMVTFAHGATPRSAD
ncbi:MAG: MFS transporter [Hymenobacter sp.]